MPFFIKYGGSMKHCFVILHYLSWEVTSACIDSVCSTYQQTEQIHYHIIVVDNASPNDSFSQLRKRYDGHPDITLLQASENLGFAKGNNLGYRYALEKLQADFIIIANNDTEFRQPDFLSAIEDIYRRSTPALIGPDILNINGYHQNPYRNHPVTNRELSRWLRNRRLWLMFLHLDKHLRLSEHLPCFHSFYEKRAAAGRPQNTWQQEQKNVVLQGACIIFTPPYTKVSPSYAFYPGTYMYCEEDILAYLCQRTRLTVCYTPSLQVIHKESVSTSLSHTSQREKDTFLTRNIIKSLKIFKKLRRR